MDRKTDIMGIVNLTDDSYFAQSRCNGVDAVLEKVRIMVDEGASIIDFGACSTRPGSVQIGAEAEWKRLEPALRAVREAFPDISISIDTIWSDVVRKAYSLIGDFIVNDISAGEDDPQMLPLVAELGLTYIAMHKRGDSCTMQQLCDYEDVTDEVIRYFREFSLKADACGVREWILDPGFGFAKTTDQNYELMKGLPRIWNAFPEHRVIVGVSRKSMIYKLFDISPEESLPATQALHFAALSYGASILRVHDVAEAAQTAAIWQRLQ